MAGVEAFPGAMSGLRNDSLAQQRHKIELDWFPTSMWMPNYPSNAFLQIIT